MFPQSRSCVVVAGLVFAVAGCRSSLTPTAPTALPPGAAPHTRYTLSGVVYADTAELIFRLWFGPLKGRPTIISKVNTLFQLGYLLGVMVQAAFHMLPQAISSVFMAWANASLEG